MHRNIVLYANRHAVERADCCTMLPARFTRFCRRPRALLVESHDCINERINFFDTFEDCIDDFDGRPMAARIARRKFGR